VWKQLSLTGVFPKLKMEDLTLGKIGEVDKQALAARVPSDKVVARGRGMFKGYYVAVKRRRTSREAPLPADDLPVEDTYNGPGTLFDDALVDPSWFPTLDGL
jgi:hypothetical protein